MSGKLREFTKKWLVTIVMVPSLACKLLRFHFLNFHHLKFANFSIFVVMHIGWMRIQNVEAFVRPDEHKGEYPLTSLLHKIQSSTHLDEKIRKFVHTPD